MTTSLENIDKQVAVAMESFGTLSKKTVTLSNFKNELEISELGTEVCPIFVLE